MRPGTKSTRLASLRLTVLRTEKSTSRPRGRLAAQPPSRRVFQCPASFRLGDDLAAMQVGAQHGRDGHAAVGVLVVLQNGDDHARQGQSRTVERMDELRPGSWLRTEADIGAASLVVAE